MKRSISAAAVAALLLSAVAGAATPLAVYTGSVAGAGLVLFTTDDLTDINACNLISTVGAVQLQVSYDGSTWVVHNLEDKGGTTLDPVLTTTQGKPYGYVGFAKQLRVVSSGGAATATLRCGRIG